MASSEEYRLSLDSRDLGTVAGVACVASLERRTTRTGDPYLDVNLRNRTGAISAKVWKEGVPAWAEIQPGDAVWVEGRIKPGYRAGTEQELEVREVRLLDPEHWVRNEMNPECPVPLHVLAARFEALCTRLSPPARSLLDVVIDQVGREAFWTAPAAQGHHHAYLRGLVEHSIEVGEIACRIADTEPYGSHIDRDALIVGALVHDIGKVHEYCWQGEPIRFSPEGRLRSHISRGPEIVALATATNSNDLVEAGLNPRIIDVVQHVQESHHGMREWGSPVEPCTLEAVIVHIADLASARLRSMLDDLQSGVPNDAGWVMPPSFRKRPVLTLNPAVCPNSGDADPTGSSESTLNMATPVAEFIVVRAPAPHSPNTQEDR